MQLVQMRLLVDQFSEAYDYYANVLGLTPQRGMRNGPYEKFSFPNGDAAVAIQNRADVAAAIPLTDRDVALIAIKVDDIEAAATAITGRGGTLLAPPALRYGALRTAYLRDPAGNLLELQQW